MEVPAIAQAASAVVGICALILSVYNARVQYLNGKARVVVALSYGIAVPQSVTGVSMCFRNVGEKDVRLTGCGLVLPGNRTAVFPLTQSLPATVVSGDSVSEFRELDVLRESFRNNGLSGPVTIRAYVDDAVGRRYVSRNSICIELAAASNAA